MRTVKWVSTGHDVAMQAHHSVGGIALGSTAGARRAVFDGSDGRSGPETGYVAASLREVSLEVGPPDARRVLLSLPA